MKILILNGPNLNRQGRREPEKYGTTTMEECVAALRARYPQADFVYRQSNCEGALIDILQEAEDEGGYVGVVMNAGAYSHTSLAIADAIASITTPVIEVHITNTAARGGIRATSMIAPVCRGSIVGFGIDSYRLAVEALLGNA